MNKTRGGILVKVLPLLLVALSLAFLPGCGKSDTAEPITEAQGTALSNLAVAESAVEAAASDAKLLVVQAPSVTIVGASPLWVFTFGSPESGQMYKVSAVNGKVTDTLPGGDAPLEDAEWASVPEKPEWKVDSDTALEKALKKAGIETPDNYSMLLETYVPASATDSQVTAFVWYVFFNVGEDGEPAAIVSVDASSGEAKLVE